MSVQTALRSTAGGTLRSQASARVSSLTRGPLTPALPTRSFYHTNRLIPSTNTVSSAQTLRNPKSLFRCLPPSAGLAVGPRLYSTLPDSYPRNPGAWSKWVVKLLLHWEAPGTPNASPAVGSGFFVNIPESTHDVIFTAGHNLIASNGARVWGVDVLVNGVKTFTARTHGTDYHISDSYQKTPNDTNPVHDYGCILLPREKDAKGKPIPRDGFGFSMALAAGDLRTMGLIAFVGGYPGELNAGENVEFRYTMGSFGTVDEGQLFYHATTEKGQSGGPVWVLYKGYETVIGIHNHDQRVEGTGNRATRLDVSTMYDFYKWAGVGAAYGKSLRSINYKENPAGLFLKVNSESRSTLARLGQDGNATKFDIIPAHTAPTDAGRAPRYAVLHKPNPADGKTWQWLKFKTDPATRPRQVTGNVGAATEESMVRLHTVGAKKPGFDKNMYQFEAAALSEKPPSPHDPRYLLRVEGRGIPKEIAEGDDCEPESPDVQLVDVASGDANLLNYTKFRLE